MQPMTVKRQNAEGTAQIEGLVVASGFFGVEENSADEKSEEDKEQIHPAPSDAGGDQQVGKKARGRVHSRSGMTEENQQDGDAAQSIKRGDTHGGVDIASL